MKAGSISAALCSICGERRTTKGDCLACLLRGGLEEIFDHPAAPPASLGYGDFEIARREDGSFWELGHGAMGVTYRATDKVLHRRVALKVIEVPAAAGGSEAVRERFLREARAAAALRHPNVAGVFQFGASPEVNRCYYAMELVEGETLEARVRRNGPLKVELALAIAIQVTRALMAAAAQNLIHRDLKPANIMLTPNEARSEELEVKVIDFGLAKVTAEAANEKDITHGGFVGTPAFASPEQFGGLPADARSDIYSLGVTLWYALTGELPCPGKTIEEIRHCQTEVALPIRQLLARKIPKPVIRLLQHTLAVDPAQRPASSRELLEALESCRAHLARPNESSLRRWAAAILVAALVAAALFALRTQRPKMAPASIPEKSIAVLPFENIGDNKDNSDFAAGIQDDVLTSLAQIHELKVISRTSVMAYQKAGGRNIREIAQALGVANVLEGSVRRAGDRVLVNVQLIDARNDRHVWAQRYDRTVADSIGLQGELATQIAAALQATLAPDEKARLGGEPTANSEAYVLYLTALGKEATDWEAAEQLHVQAAAIDPKFALAYAHASILNSWFSHERHAKARAQAEEAVRLSPKLGEGHVALGLCLFVDEKKYDAALKEFEIAAATSPNDANIYKYVAVIYRRQGRWRDAVANFDRAISLDPLNPAIIQWAANNHVYLRDWAAAAAGYTRRLEIEPESMGARSALAYLEVFRNGNPAAGAKLLQNIPPGRDPSNYAPFTRWDLAMLKRDYAAADRLSSDLPELPFPKSFYQARTALARGDMEAARRYFAATTPVFEARVRDHPDDADGHSRLGILYGYMRRKEDAIRESRRAVELEPESRNAFHGALYSASLALVYALVGEEDAAMTLIERLLSTPGAVSYPDFPYTMTLADLRLRWEWDSLRSNPRFQKILAGPEPKTVY